MKINGGGIPDLADAVDPAPQELVSMISQKKPMGVGEPTGFGGGEDPRGKGNVPKLPGRIVRKIFLVIDQYADWLWSWKVPLMRKNGRQNSNKLTILEKETRGSPPMLGLRAHDDEAINGP